MTLIVIGGLVLLAVAVLAGMIVFGRGDAPPPLASVSEPFSRVDFRDLPPPQTTPSRDGSLITFRVLKALSQIAVLDIRRRRRASSGRETSRTRSP
jgi:hypothetical protein